MINKAEQDFAEMFEEVLWASFSEDVNQHWDLSVDGLKIDVKGIKRVQRKGNLDVRYHWVEFQNVRGRKGWMYGEADYIAFELVDNWLLIDREDLVHFSEENVKEEYTSDFPLYKKKTRPGRKDIISLIPTEDLIQIGTLIPKYVLNQDSGSDTEISKAKLRPGDFRNLLVCKGKGTPTTLLPQ